VRTRRLMLKMSQTALGDALGLTFQQVQKYEKGRNRIGASRLQQIAGILQVPVSFFFEGVPEANGKSNRTSLTSDYTTAFMATTAGLTLSKAFMEIKDTKLQRSIVELVKGLAEARRD
jgi:transcriptional regulator with XRE-family HTH domain